MRHLVVKTGTRKGDVRAKQCMSTYVIQVKPITWYRQFKPIT